MRYYELERSHPLLRPIPMHDCKGRDEGVGVTDLPELVPEDAHHPLKPTA